MYLHFSFKSLITTFSAKKNPKDNFGLMMLKHDTSNPVFTIITHAKGKQTHGIHCVAMLQHDQKHCQIFLALSCREGPVNPDPKEFLLQCSPNSPS